MVAGAFLELGNTGIIEHSCSQCTQLYKQTAYFLVNEDAAAVIGADENGTVPDLTGEHADYQHKKLLE